MTSKVGVGGGKQRCDVKGEVGGGKQSRDVKGGGRRREAEL